MRFVAGRLAALVPVLALVLAIVFLLVRAIPGDPAVVLLGPGATQAQIAALRDQLRLDLPAPLQFLEYVAALARGDLGTSLKTSLGIGRGFFGGCTPSRDIYSLMSCVTPSRPRRRMRIGRPGYSH